jgi:four helix bundle protein
MQPFRRLDVWRKAHELTLRVYRITDRFSSRHAALRLQLTRAAHSIPSNIAEGSGRSSGRQFSNSLQISIGSARELDYFLLLAADLELISRSEQATLEARTEQVTKMLVGLRRHVRQKLKAPKKR